ncbi:hypothetical protein CLOM_g22054 [Closterium sp. NIES-68]|nr:hypothetical protein CLOM_g22054 [Closterium sp. NIES-68]GJP77758.1 hypothetical protein CLOP_g8109 [Closterium sp. NIES-67]
MRWYHLMRPLRVWSLGLRNPTELRWYEIRKTFSRQKLRQHRNELRNSALRNPRIHALNRTRPMAWL